MRRLAPVLLAVVMLAGCAQKPARVESFMAIEAMISIDYATFLVGCMNNNLEAFPPPTDALAREHAEMRTAAAALDRRTEALALDLQAAADDLDAADWDRLVESGRALQLEAEPLQERWMAYNERRRAAEADAPAPAIPAGGST